MEQNITFKLGQHSPLMWRNIRLKSGVILPFKVAQDSPFNWRHIALCNAVFGPHMAFLSFALISVTICRFSTCVLDSASDSYSTQKKMLFQKNQYLNPNSGSEVIQF